MDLLQEEDDSDITTTESGDYGESFDPLYLEEIQATIRRIELKKSGPLINVDYNLNSPLIDERPVAVLKLLQHLPVDRRLSSIPGVKDAVSHLSRLGINWDLSVSAEGFHKWVAECIFLGEIKTTCFSKRFSRLLKQSGDAVTVLDIFWRKLPGNSNPLPVDPLKTKWVSGDTGHPSQPRLIQDGEWFRFCHRLVMMMNSSTPEERTSLVRVEEDDLQWKVEENETGFVATSSTSQYGTITVVPVYIYLHSHHRLLNRDMVLMIKDTLIARYASKLSLVCRADGKDGPESLGKLTEFYKQGDLLMMRMGNDVYEVIKMVEPHCTYQMSVIAHQNRPLIPLDSSFRYHLSSTLLNCEEEYGVKLDPLFDLIKNERSHRQTLLYYGSFRHWGHPFLDYQDGLNKLYQQVTMAKEIDQKYAETLASDLTLMILEKEFFTQRKWFVDIEKMAPLDPMIKHVKNTTWPTPQEIRDYGDKWHHLPITCCYSIPQTIDPSVLYSDRSHSMNRTEVLNHIRTQPHREIPSRKVLRTALETLEVNVKDFLQKVNDAGCPVMTLSLD